jgi:hypothetical protein
LTEPYTRGEILTIPFPLIWWPEVNLVLPLKRQVSIQVDDMRRSLRLLGCDARDYHARVAVTDENDA